MVTVHERAGLAELALLSRRARNDVNISPGAWSSDVARQFLSGQPPEIRIERSASSSLVLNRFQVRNEIRCHSGRWARDTSSALHSDTSKAIGPPRRYADRGDRHPQVG